MAQRLFKMLLIALYMLNVQFSPINLDTESDNKSFSIIWLSDTQDMSYRSYGHALQKMGSWIISMKQDLNVKYIVQTGDAVDNGASLWQWDNYDELYDQISGEIPYISAAGNHEVKKNGYLEYCMRPDILSIPRANSFLRGVSSFSTFEVNECKFIVVAIGFGMEEKSVSWVNRVLRDHIQMFHTDRGSEFDNMLIDELLDSFQINRSLSMKGCPYDNAVAESTFKMIKAEFVYSRRFETLEQLQLELLDYVHWFNNIRLHGTLGYLSPAEFKRSRTL